VIPAGPSGRPPAPITHHLVDGLAVVRRRSERPAATVLLVHGAMDRAASFGRVMRRLAAMDGAGSDGAGFDVIALDRRGYAGSLGAGVAATLGDHARDLARVAEWSGAGDLVVVGHSLGGTIALLAAQHELGGRPLRAVGAFEAPVPRAGDAGPAGERALAVAARDGAAAAAEDFYRSMVGERTWARLRPADRAARLAEGPALVAELADLRAPTRLDPSGLDPAAIAVPVHLARGSGSHDHLREVAATTAAAIGGVLTEIGGAGHGAHLSHPAEFARWVAAVGGRARGTDTPDPSVA